METKGMSDTQAVKIIENTANAKSTKDRLDELRDLFKDGYVTELEFKIARVNILKEGGIDVVTRLQQHAHRPYFQEEDESKSYGCGCFLLTFLLAAALVLGVSFFAAPYWPDRFGGAGARVAREWAIVKGEELIDRFFGEPADSTQIPDPIPSDDEHRGGNAPEAARPDEQSEAESESATVPPPSEPSEVRTESVAPLSVAPLSAAPLGVAPPVATLPSPDMHILSLPSDAVETVIAEPDITVEERIPVAENAVRGYVTVPNARIRSAPDTSTNDNVLGWARTGERFIVLEEGAGIGGSKWYNVVFENGDKRGWISGSLVRLEL